MFLKSYLNFFEKNHLDSHNNGTIILGDFNAPGMNWSFGCCDIDILLLC